jgi:hypothetical protein
VVNQPVLGVFAAADLAVIRVTSGSGSRAAAGRPGTATVTLGRVES